MGERYVYIGELAKEAAVHAEAELSTGNPVRRMLSRTVYTGDFLVRKGQEATPILHDEGGDWRSINQGPIGNPDFSCNAAPELTGFGRLWHDTIRGFAKYPPPGFAVPPIEDPELDNMLEINKEAKKNPDGITRVSIWEK